MHYLHGSVIVSHGFLSAMTCLVDSRFVIKISDFGLTELRNAAVYEPPDHASFDQDFRVFLWRAPELLRQTMPAQGTQVRMLTTFPLTAQRFPLNAQRFPSKSVFFLFFPQKGHCMLVFWRIQKKSQSDFTSWLISSIGDVYSFAILLQQIALRNEPFEPDRDGEDDIVNNVSDVDIRQIVMQVKQGSTPAKRPVVSVTSCTAELRALMAKCWAEWPADRPAFTKVKDVMKKIAGSVGENIIDHLIEQMEQYAADLEKKVARKSFLQMNEQFCCIIPLCWVTFCIHSGIIPVGPFSRKCAKSNNQSSVALSVDWLIDAVPVS